MAGLVELTGTAPSVSARLKQPPTILDGPPLGLRRPNESLPDIVVGTASLGHETLAAIDAEVAAGGGPGVPAAPLPAGPSAPEIVVGTAPLGRDSLAAIQQDVRGAPGVLSSSPEVRVELVSIGRDTALELVAEERRGVQALAAAPMPDPVLTPKAERLTQPWAEPAADALRTARAEEKGRNVGAPRVTLRLEDADDELVDALLAERDTERDDARTAAVERGKTPAPALDEEKGKERESLDIWHDALTKTIRSDRRPPR